MSAVCLQQYEGRIAVDHATVCCALVPCGPMWLQLSGVAIGFLQLAHPATHAFTNTLKLWLVRASGPAAAAAAAEWQQ